MVDDKQYREENKLKTISRQGGILGREALLFKEVWILVSIHNHKASS